MASLQEKFNVLINDLTMDNADEFLFNLKRILQKMACYISQSEPAILEYQENWRKEYTEALFADHNSQTSEPSSYRETSAPNPRVQNTRTRAQNTPDAQTPRYCPMPNNRRGIPHQTVMSGTRNKFSGYY